MAEQLYRVVFEGEILEGSQVQEVKRALAKLYNTREDKVERFFSGKRLAVKKDVDYETAMKYVQAFERAGAVCRIEELETHTGLDQPLMLEKDTEKPSQQDDVMVCPKCQFEQAPSEECVRCGIIISKYSERFNAPESESKKEGFRIEPERRNFKLPTIAIVFLVVFLAIGFYYFSGTPRYSLYKIARAIKKHDSGQFHKYVDVDRIVDNLASVAVEQAGQELDSELAMLLPKMMEALKPQIRQKITELIEDEDRWAKAGPLPSASIAEIQTEGSTSLVTLENENTGEKIRLKMAKSPDRYWKIVEIDLDSFQTLSHN